MNGNALALGVFFGEIAAVYFNLGLMMGLTFGAMILLRPVTNRLLSPKRRVTLWLLGWYTSFFISMYDILGGIKLLPVSFRSLVGTGMGAMSRTYQDVPAFFPVQAGDPLTLPGGASFPLDLTEEMFGVFGLLWLAAVSGWFLWYHWEERRLRRLGQQGERMDWNTQAKYGLADGRIAIRLCDNLPTSFVRQGHDTGRKDGVRHVICLQRELPQEQMRLVLLHEKEHIEQRHVWLKGWMSAALGLFWWNPILWLAHRLTCRDMELACDEAVMAKLDERDRRDYARTLVDLGAGRHMWGNFTSFGECDAALRVKNIVDWKPEEQWKTVLSWGLTMFLFLFFYCGGWSGVRAERDAAWDSFITGEAVHENVEDIIRRGPEGDYEVRNVQEVWVREDNSILEWGYKTVRILDDRGTWHLMSFDWSGHDWYWHSHTIVDNPNVEGYTRVQ